MVWMNRLNASLVTNTKWKSAETRLSKEIKWKMSSELKDEQLEIQHAWKTLFDDLITRDSARDDALVFVTAIFVIFPLSAINVDTWIENIFYRQRERIFLWSMLRMVWSHFWRLLFAWAVCGPSNREVTDDLRKTSLKTLKNYHNFDARAIPQKSYKNIDKNVEMFRSF